MFVCMYISVCIHMCMCVCVYMCVGVCMYIWCVCVAQMLRDAERVSNLARDRAVSLTEKTKLANDLQVQLEKACTSKEEVERSLARALVDLQAAQAQLVRMCHVACERVVSYMNLSCHM